MSEVGWVDRLTLWPDRVTCWMALAAGAGLRHGDAAPVQGAGWGQPGCCGAYLAAERMESRRVLVYATNARTRGITGRMDDILTRHGYRGAVMKTEAVAFQTAGEWVAIG